MSERRLQPVTRIRGELQPTIGVVNAVNRFLERPVDPRSLRLYTTAQTIVPQGEDRSRYARELADIQRKLAERKIAQRVLALAAPLRFQGNKDGSGRLFFDVASRHKRDLAFFGEQLRRIESLEEDDGTNLLYAEFARDSLARSEERRREDVRSGATLLHSRLRHPSASHSMTASGLHIVTRDMRYLVADPQSLPLAE